MTVRDGIFRTYIPIDSRIILPHPDLSRWERARVREKG
jgi:hypothetical protein